MNEIKYTPAFQALKDEILSWSGNNNRLKSLTSCDAIIRFISDISVKRQMDIQDKADELMDKVERCYKEYSK